VHITMQQFSWNIIILSLNYNHYRPCVSEIAILQSHNRYCIPTVKAVNCCIWCDKEAEADGYFSPALQIVPNMATKT